MPEIQQLPILYSFRRCPYAMRARMAIKYSGITAEIREILLRDKPQSMLKASPKGTVPVLITSDGQVIDQSLDIMLWALKINDPQQWLAFEDSGKLTIINSLIIENDTSFKQALDNYKYSVRQPEHSAEFYRDSGQNFIKKLDDMLQDNKYLLDSKITLADIAIFPFIRQFAFVDKLWFYDTNYNKLKKWLDSFLQSDLFNCIMHKYSPWTQGQKVIFP